MLIKYPIWHNDHTFLKEMFEDFSQQLYNTHHLSSEEETKETGTLFSVALNIHRQFSWCNHEISQRLWS